MVDIRLTNAAVEVEQDAQAEVMITDAAINIEDKLANTSVQVTNAAINIEDSLIRTDVFITNAAINIESMDQVTYLFLSSAAIMIEYTEAEEIPVGGILGYRRLPFGIGLKGAGL
jgi:hypothetical protein